MIFLESGSCVGGFVQYYEQFKCWYKYFENIINRILIYFLIKFNIYCYE